MVTPEAGLSLMNGLKRYLFMVKLLNVLPIYYGNSSIFLNRSYPNIPCNANLESCSRVCLYHAERMEEENDAHC